MQHQDSAHLQAQNTKALLLVLLQHNIYLTEENSRPGIILTLIVRKPDLKLFFFARVPLE